eukprot:5366766-Prymnesium_polylepis.1
MEERPCHSPSRSPLAHPQNMHTLSGSTGPSCRGRPGPSVGVPWPVLPCDATSCGVGGSGALTSGTWRPLASA